VTLTSPIAWTEETTAAAAAIVAKRIVVVLFGFLILEGEGEGSCFCFGSDLEKAETHNKTSTKIAKKKGPNQGLEPSLFVALREVPLDVPLTSMRNIFANSFFNPSSGL
jgi:hypothetical protein